MASTFEGSNAGTKPGIEIWRIEKKQPVRVPPETYGVFYSGDCYLVLYTYQKSTTSSKLDANLHYFQGEASSQDERGYSAYFAIALDDYLQGVPVQYREVQGHESALFLSYFPEGVRYQEGGVDSAFRHVDPNSYQPRLFQVKGKRNVRCTQVAFAASSLNDGDTFILDDGLTVYQFNGKSANRQEKFKGLEMAQKIKDQERGGKARLVFLESGDSNADSQKFFSLLKGSPSDVKPASAGGDDEQVHKEVASLWRVSDASGSIVITEVARGKLEKSMLDNNDVFLLDGGNEVFVWIGSGATPDERKKGMEFGSNYLKEYNKPDWVPLIRLPAGGETPQFKSRFISFDVELAPQGDDSAARPYVPKERKMELGVLLEKQKKAEEKLLATGGSVTVYRVQGNQKIELSKEEQGQFNSGDSYIVLYKYKNGQRDSYIIYMWHGRDARQDEQGTAAYLTVELAGTLADLQGSQVRVVQNKEPAHFLALFKGRMVVRTTSGASDSSSSAFGSDSRLFHVRGTTPVDTRAVEVRPVAASLNSGDVFVLTTPSAVFVWFGSGSNDEERSTASNLATSVIAPGRELTQLNEGAESDEFWSALGGKSEYASSKELQSQPVEPRLFSVSGVTGDFQVEELFNFSQDDLVQDGVFLLDIVSEVYVWLGNTAREADKNAALEMAVKYVQQAPDGRDANTPVYKITAGAEPPNFVAQFRGWDHAKANDFEDPYAKKLKLLQASSSSSSSSSAPVKPSEVARQASVTPVKAAAASAAVAPAPSSSAPVPAASTTYSLAELKAGVAGVDGAKKESYLNDADFKAALGVDRDAFYKLAGWKQQELKKKVGIF